MTVKKQKNKLSAISYNDLIIGVGTSILFLFISWMIDILNNNLNVSFNTIAEIHKSNPIHWLIDLLPFIVGIVIYFSIKKREKDKIAFEKIIEQRDQDINRNARFAKKIGEGIYDDNDDLINEDDIIGKSLIVMRNNLLANNKKEKEQNWISEGKDLISRILRMNNHVDELAYEVIVKLIKYISILQGSFYLYDEETKKLRNNATYAYNRKRYTSQEFKIGEGLIGQCAYEQDIVYRTEIPEDYASITSGILGDKKPSSILIVPLIAEEKLQGIIEFASIEDKFPELTIEFLRELGEIIARTLYNLRMNQKTEKLLQESQQM
ncbi:MAG: GAF domain-containing protein, partial [Bacteroidales bacterium]|nr:GAF domain-containing protein [Bacteroidales bacterium]